MDSMLGLIALWSLSGLLAVWVIYPAAVAVVAAFATTRRGKPSPGANTSRAQPNVSVIIATREDACTIRDRIADCLRTSYQPAKLEVIVGIDHQASRCSSEDIGSVPANVRLVAGDPPGGKAATLNAAVRAARGQILVFADAHQRFDRAAIPELVAALQTTNVGAVSGSLSLPHAGGPRSVASRYWAFERWLRSREAAVHSSVGVSGSIWAIRKELWTGFPPLLILDDLYAPLQVVLCGYRVAFADGARAIETREHDAAQEYHRKVRTLTGVIQVCAWLPRVLSPIHNPIWLQFIFHKLLRFLTPYWLAAIALWAAMTAARSFSMALSIAGIAALSALAVRHVRPNLVRHARQTVVSAALLQVATIIGAANGLRGRWNVWH